MSALRKIKKHVILFVVNTFLRGTRFFGLKQWLLNRCNGIKIGANTKIVTPIYIPCYSTFQVGEDCWIGRGLCLEGNGKLCIGDRCDIAPEVVFATGSHEIGEDTRRAGVGINGCIEVEQGTWIGTRAIILPNVVVGSGCVVGAGSLVVKNLASNGCYGGNPAKLIRELKGG